MQSAADEICGGTISSAAAANPATAMHSARSLSPNEPPEWQPEAPPAFACCLGTHVLNCERPCARHSGAVADALEDAVCRRLVYRDAPDAANGSAGDDAGVVEEDREENDDPVQIFVSEDAHLLRCRPVHSSDHGESTIFGIVESAASLGGSFGDGGNTPVHLTLLEPRCDERNQATACRCRHPRGNWTRRQSLHATSSNQSMNGVGERSPSFHASVEIVDLTKIQEHRRSSGSTEQYPSFDTPGKVLHLLRSVLGSCEGGLHCASPWNEMYYSCRYREGGNCDRVVALLVRDTKQLRESSGSESAGEDFWDDVERKEADELLHFRTGDAAPSYFLHSATPLLWAGKLDIVEDLQEAGSIRREEKVDASSSNVLLLVYRRLPPRDVLTHAALVHEKEYLGCLRETYLKEAKEAESDNGVEPAIQPPPMVKHRMVAPPYQSHTQEYPGLLDQLLDGIDAIRQEAQRIPQWSAWPEANHYTDNSWNVFPLCYTFPADDISKRKFVHKTCAFVPETTRLLGTLGPTLRTALFSRLDPRASLGAHTGWSDLANHVLRVHIPLVVPGGKCNEGLCGTWVDGCVETHDEGRVVCFDDSKTHRAFNYSDGERIVLIVDLLRPAGLPKGTATGGHSDELDAFISAF